VCALENNEEEWKQFGAKQIAGVAAEYAKSFKSNCAAILFSLAQCA
jgi:hypothetical protein